MKPEGKTAPSRSELRWDDKIKMDLRIIACEVWTVRPGREADHSPPSSVEVKA